MGTFSTTTTFSTNMIGLSLDTATTSLVNNCITEGENECRKYLSRRYDTSGWTTGSATPPMVKTICDWYTEGLIWQRSSRGGKESWTRGENMIKRALDNLKDLRDRKADLLDSSNSVISDKSTSDFKILSTTSGYTETFAEDNPLNWRVDADKITDIADDRV